MVIRRHFVLLLILICGILVDAIKPAIRFCCNNLNCEEFTGDEFLVPKDYDLDLYETIEVSEFEILKGKPCEKIYKLEPFDFHDDRWNFSKDGRIFNYGQYSTTDDYCLKINANNTVDVFLCLKEVKNFRYTIFPIGMLLSIPFLMITFFVYAYIPKLRNLHGKCIMCYVFALTIFYLSLAIVQLQVFQLHDLSVWCTFAGFSTYFGVFLCFFWLNIMCYDIWHASKNNFNTRTETEERKKFLRYLIYGFGGPIIITALILLIDLTEIFHEDFLPRFGVQRCWIHKDRLVEAIFVYIPISTITASNIIFFILTAKSIWKSHSSVGNEGSLLKRSIASNRFNIYLRLFLIMGISWVWETISWGSDSNNWFTNLMDLLNCLQGIIVFIFCVLNTRTRTLVAKKFCSSNSTTNETIDSGFLSATKTADV